MAYFNNVVLTPLCAALLVKLTEDELHFTTHTFYRLLNWANNSTAENQLSPMWVGKTSDESPLARILCESLAKKLLSSPPSTLLLSTAIYEIGVAAQNVNTIPIPLQLRVMEMVKLLRNPATLTPENQL